MTTDGQEFPEWMGLPWDSPERAAAKAACDAARPVLTPDQELELAERRLSNAAKNGKFWVGMVDLFETMANRWEEFSQEQFDREVEAMKASDMVEFCKLEWKRAAVKVRDLKATPSPRSGSEREAA